MKAGLNTYWLFLILSLIPANLRSTVAPFYSPRSQGIDAVRELVGWQQFINQCDQYWSNGVIAIVGQYSQSFHSREILNDLFGKDIICDAKDRGTIGISGSCVPDRASTDWLADYFGLPTDFQSSVSFDPRISNIIFDIQLNFGLDGIAPGLYFRIFAPVVHTIWKLNTCERIINEGINDYLPGYFDPTQNSSVVPATGTQRNNLLHSALDFFTGKSSPTLNGVIFQPLRAARWGTVDRCDSLSKTALADVAAVVGYNLMCTPDLHAGVNIRAAAPAGNSPHGSYLFEPIVGDGHHWEFGCGFSGHYALWRSTAGDSFCAFYMDINISHMFKACQLRYFDLCPQGDNSRYMLAQRVSPNLDALEGVSGGTTTVSNFQFAQEFAPVANITLSSVNITVAAQADIACKISFIGSNGLSADLGYNFWGRTSDKIRRRNECNTHDVREWALKGDAFVFGFQSTDLTPIALAATESAADIHSGTNFITNDCTSSELSSERLNPRIDNPQPAQAGAVVLLSAAGAGQTNTSIFPVTIQEQDINLARTGGFSNKVFAHVSYAWINHPDWVPFVGIGGSAEFAPKNSCPTACCNAKTSCCDYDGSVMRTMMNQWSAWLKGGVSFN